MLLLSDIRQGIFYAMLCSFWLIFAGEHMLIQESGERNSLKIYWRHLLAVITGCVSLFLFDICERGIQLRNPFYSIWVSRFGSKIAVSKFLTILFNEILNYLIFLDVLHSTWSCVCCRLLHFPLLHGLESFLQHQHQAKCFTNHEQSEETSL